MAMKSLVSKSNIEKFLPVLLAIIIYASPAVAADEYPELVSEEWLSVSFGGQKIGFQYEKVEKGIQGYRFTGRAVIRMKLMDQPQDMSFTSDARLDANLRMKDFVYLQSIRDQRQRVAGVMEGDMLKLTVTGAGGESVKRYRLDEKTRFADAAVFEFSQNPAVGKKLSVPVFIPSLRAMETMTMEVTGRKAVEVNGAKVEAWVVEYAMQGITSRAYVAPDGRKLREESPMGLVAVATTREEAVKLEAADVPVTSIITFSLITPNRPVERQESLASLSLALKGLNDPRAFPVDERQSAGEAERVADGKRGRVFSIPVTLRKVGPPARPLSIAEAGKAAPEALEATPEIQSDHRMIRKVAGEVTAGAKDSWEAARAINRWTHRTLKKEFVDSFTALDALLEKRGECQSHTNLFAALARAAGIPTRTAAGLVYTSSSQGFLYHAWPEVYVGRWVAMDPTFGQDVADVTHIKLVEGGLESQLGLLRYIGRIGIEITEMR